MKSRNWTFIVFLLIILLFTLPSQSQAICPTRFYAQAVTVQRATELDIYFSRAQVETAADCAIFCGKRQFCRSAIYNHDSKSCALSYDKVVECKTQKQRYNTFHLTTDGAESISLITCVELCERDRPKFQDSKPSTLFSRNEPSKHEETNSAAQFLEQMAKDKAFEKEPEHGSGQSGQFVAISKGHLGKTNKEGRHELPPEIIDSDTPSTVIIEALQRLMHEVNETKEGEGKKKPTQSGQLIGRIETETQLNTRGAHEFGLDELTKNKSDSVNLLGIKNNHKPEKHIANHTVQLTDHRENKKHELTAKDLITSGVATAPLKRVEFHAQPLQIQEMFNGTSNLSSQAEAHHTGGTQDSNSGGFFKWLKPGEKFTLPPEVNLPPEVARLVPELLSAVGRNEVGRLRGKGLSFEITEKDTMPAKNASNPDEINLQELKRTLTRFAKIKVEDEEEEEKRESREKEEKVKEVFNSAASSLDQIVVNGRLLSVDEIRNLMQKEFSSSTTTTTARPWKPASQLFGASDEDDEDDQTPSTTTKKPIEKYPDHPHHDEKPGFLNTFLIQGISSMIQRENDALPHQHHLHAKPKSQAHPPTSTSLPFLTTSSLPSLTSTTTASGPIVCYRQIPQQNLLYASFETLHGISLNECRCRCAESWLNLTSAKESSSLKCKSLLYNEVTRECSLNQGDHNGKYDLIYDKYMDYHYVSCEIKYLLSAARRVCAKILPSLANNLPSPLRIHESDPNTSEPLLRDSQNSKSTSPNFNQKSLTKIEDSKEASGTYPKLTTTSIPLTTNQLPAILKEIPPAKLEKINLDEVSKTTNKLAEKVEKITSVKKEEEKAETTTERNLKATVKADDSDLLIQEVDRKEEGKETTKPLSTTTSQPLIAVTDKPLQKQKIVAEYQTTRLPSTTKDPAERRITTSLKEKPIIFVSTDSTTQTIPSTTTTSYDPLTISGYNDGCFEVIEGFMMQSTAGGLERDVESLSECQCYCANSLSSKRYAFQCTSATYYPNERDCVLNLDDRKLRPDAFMRQEVANENVTYLGLTCQQEKAIQLHTRKGQCKREFHSSTSTTTTTTTSNPALHSDDCFLELANYVLEGTALAVETNVTVDECKCYCVDAERRYGTDCQSLEYYYDSRTCLLNKENRITAPDRFNYDAHGPAHSYFDYRCHSEKLTLAVYIEQVCSRVIDLKMSDIQPTTDTSLDVEDDGEDHANEVRLVTQTQLPSVSRDDSSTQRVKTLKFINESEDDFKSGHEIVDDSREDLSSRSNEDLSEQEDSIKERRKQKKKMRRKLAKIEAEERKAAEARTSTERPETTTKITTTVETKRPKSGKELGLAEIEELEGEEELQRFEATSTTERPSTMTTTLKPTTTTRPPTTERSKPSTTTQSTTTTTTQKPYLPVGQCRYSALYQTAFNGERLIRRFKVMNATQCFAGCHWERCRSANLIQSGDPIKFCELYRDSIVDFRRTDVLYFDRDTVHFDSINCDEKPEP